MKYLALVTALIAGCAYVCRDDVPRQCTSIDFAWYRVMSETREPPAVEWRSTSCGIEPYPERIAVMHGGQCYDGLYWRWPNVIQLAYTPGSEIWETALVHELMHAHLMPGTDGDPGHLILGHWQLVNFINQELASNEVL